MTTAALLERWGPTVGINNLAELAVGTFWRHSTHCNREAYDAAQSMPAVFDIYGLARHAAIGRPCPTFVEIGVQHGASTMVLLAVAAQVHGHVYSMEIDPACGHGPLRDYIEEQGQLPSWTFLPGASQSQPPIPDTDFLLVDGDHEYAAVCQDMAIHGVAVRPGGIILLDDYHVAFPGKVRWIQERWQELRPLTLGPHVILVKGGDDNPIYQRTYPGDTWEWRI